MSSSFADRIREKSGKPIESGEPADKTPARLCVFAGVMVALAANAQAEPVRSFPSDSKLGELTALQYPTARIGGQDMRLGAGGQIRGRNNLLILPAMLTEFGPIRYQTDPMGNVHRIWLLTAEEAAQANGETGQR